MKYYTYLYTDPKTNLPIYIGKGCNDRAFSHRWGNKRRLSRLINKRREEGYIMQPIINYEVDEATALEMEKFWIAFYGRENLKTGSLFNLTDGGEGVSGVKMPPRNKEYKDKMSKAKKNINDSTRAKMSKAGRAKGRKISTPFGIYESARCAAEALNIDRTTIYWRIRKFPKQYYLFDK